MSTGNRWPILIAVLAAAANMRLAVVQVGPVIEEIRADTGAGSAIAGALTTIPFVCAGLFAFAGSGLVRRIGTVATIRLSLALVAGGTLTRAVMPTAVLMLVPTVAVGVGIAMLGVALPAVVKRHFSDRAGAMTGWYIAAMSGFAAIVGLITVPLANLFGGWRYALAVAALPGAAALGVWIGRDHEPPPAIQPEGRAHVRRRLVATLALVFGFQAICFTTMIAWIAALYEDAGWSQGTATLATASIPILTMVSSLLVPVLTRPDTRRNWILATGLGMAVALVAIATVPTALAPLWLLVFGMSSGAIFPLVMTLPLDMREAPEDVAHLTAWMLGVGFIVSGAGPALAGALRDATGGFTVPVLVIAALGATSGLLARSRLLDEQKLHAPPSGAPPAAVEAR